MFETVKAGQAQRKLELLSKGQVKVSARVDLSSACKQILTASAKCFLSGVERGEGSEVRINGKIVTRVVYIDEFDAFNSEEKSEPFTERLNVKNNAVVSMNAVAVVLETTVSDNSGTSVEIDSIVDFALVGLVEQDISFVSGVNGNAESKIEKMRVATFQRAIEEAFSADDKLELDKNCAGVLGVDCTASVRDIYVDDGKITVKGSVSANVLSVKSGETLTVSNLIHEFDFSKVIHAQDLGAEDTVFGSVAVAGVSVRADNKTKPELGIEVDLMFNGHIVVARDVEFVADAFSFDNALNFALVQAEHTSTLPQVNVASDVEGSMSMPASSPFISRILAVSGAHITGVNLTIVSGKVNVEGVISATIVYECEEKLFHTHEAQVPFTTSVRVENLEPCFNVHATVSVVSCYIKARRGKELLVDAKLGISVCASEIVIKELPAEISVGEAKARDDSAIVICSVEQGETLWDVAKRVSVSCAEIVKQNPNCEKGVSLGDKIFIYRQQVINF